MSSPVSGSGPIELTGNLETDLNLVMAARLATSEGNITDKLNAMKQSTEQMKKFNGLSSDLSRLAASMKTSSPDKALGALNAEQHRILDDIKKGCTEAGVPLDSLLGRTGMSTVTLNQLTTAASTVRQKADSIGSTSQTDQLMMQQAMSKLGQIVDQWSNMMSKLAQARQTPISNMR